MEKETKKSLYDYKLGEICNEDLVKGIMKAPNKLVRIGYTFQSKEGIQMEVSLETKDYIKEYKEGEEAK